MENSNSLTLEGVYVFPGGEEAVAGVGSLTGRYFFYSIANWIRPVAIIALPVAYELREDGRLFTGRGQTTNLTVLDLRFEGLLARDWGQLPDASLK
ncbi:MAG: hypothetical protein QOH96_2442 [Blastocatellia bacterium]|jgi:hypothetical protein|nr:hypothetical protein [Blastocatellia bacterium]